MPGISPPVAARGCCRCILAASFSRRGRFLATAANDPSIAHPDARRSCSTCASTIRLRQPPKQWSQLRPVRAGDGRVVRQLALLLARRRALRFAAVLSSLPAASASSTVGRCVRWPSKQWSQLRPVWTGHGRVVRWPRLLLARRCALRFAAVLPLAVSSTAVATHALVSAAHAPSSAPHSAPLRARSLPAGSHAAAR